MSSKESARDVMQVCYNGHVITERMHSRPEDRHNHCPQCGAGTLHQCLTCGADLPGAITVPGVVPVGQARAPEHCIRCGASFPWASKLTPPSGSGLPLEQFLRRLPRAIRALRTNPMRQAEDLEHLLRALLPLFHDDVRTQSWTPPFWPRTRQLYVLLPENITLSAQIIGSEVDLNELEKQLRRDALYHKEYPCSQGVLYLYDPMSKIPNPQGYESLWSQTWEDVTVRCIISS
jgi:hypothetical protein